MQIHELNNFNGTPGATNFLAIDDGSDTSRISGEALLDPVNSRIDNLTANVLPDSVETILDWADVESASKTLTKNVSGFDYLDLYFKEVTSGTNRIVFAQRYPRTAFPAQVTIPWIYWGGGTDPKYLYFQDLMIAISGTTLTMSQLRIYSWDGKAADGASIEPGILVDQIRVDGVKISSNTNAELTDLRTAHNGTVYASARAAREADYNALDSAIVEQNEQIDANYNQNRLDINKLYDNTEYITGEHWQTMQIGSIGASGAPGSRTTTVRNSYVQSKKENEVLKILNNNWRAELHFYNNSGFAISDYLGKKSFFTQADTIINISQECEEKGAPYYALMFYRWTGSDIDLTTDVTQEEIASFNNNYVFYYPDSIKEVINEAFETVADPSMWSVNGMTSTGLYSPATIRLATKKRISYPEFSSIKVIGNYTINLAAWNNAEQFIGKLQTNGTFGTNTEAWVKSFDLSQYPDYSFVVILRNESSPNTDMNISEAANCHFIKNYLSLDKTVNDLVGSDGSDLLVEWTSKADKSFSFPAEIKAGDLIRAEIKGYTAPCDITVITVKDGVNKDALINVFGADGVGKIVGVVATVDANAIKIYCSKNNVSFKVYRVVSESPDYENLVTQIYQANARIRKNESEILEATDSNSYQILGESAIYNNKRYIADMTFKMVMLDNNYKYFSVANIKRIIDQMSDVNLNSLLIGFGGSGRGLCFKLNDMTIESYGVTYDLEDCISTSSGKYLTETDMEEIINYASSKGIEIIPYLGMPGHFTPFLAHQPQFRYQADATSINIDDRQACDYAYKIAELYMKWFARHGSKYWLFGADEFGDVHNGYYYLHSAGNYNYAKFINEIAYIAAKYRMIPFAWNDGYCIDGDIIPMLNREVPIMYWTKDNEHWATAAEIQNNGNAALINSSVNIYYVVNGPQVTEAQMRAFNVHNFADGSVISDPKGACFCIWIGNLESPRLDDDGDAITTAVLPLITAYGETINPQLGGI